MGIVSDSLVPGWMFNVRCFRSVAENRVAENPGTILSRASCPYAVLPPDLLTMSPSRGYILLRFASYQSLATVPGRDCGRW